MAITVSSLRTASTNVHIPSSVIMNPNLGTQTSYSGPASNLSVIPTTVSTTKHVPMKLFATWEVDRTPSNCIPRLCSLTFTRLVLYKSLGTDFNSLLIAVRMQSSKRTLRSNEIHLPSNGGLLDTELELSFSLQYPHFLKRDGNTLQIMLQRRKKYKNRTILGLKTLAVASINMAQVLQKQLDVELELFPEKEKFSGSTSGGAASSSSALGKIYILSLSSQPVDHDSSSERQKGISDADRVLFSDEDDDETSAEEASDSEPGLQQHHRGQKYRRQASKVANLARQRNLKQKFVSLLKKFKVSDTEVLNRSQVEQKLSEVPDAFADLLSQLNLEEDLEEEEDLDEDDLEEDLEPDVEDEEDEEFSEEDSTAEVVLVGDDSISMGSTPKPSLKPFFCSSRSLLHKGAGASSLETTTNKHEFNRIACSDRQSDDSSKDAVSDYHQDPDFTDPELSDPQCKSIHGFVSPQISGDELKRTSEGTKVSSGKTDRSSRAVSKLYKGTSADLRSFSGDVTKSIFSGPKHGAKMSESSTSRSINHHHKASEGLHSPKGPSIEPRKVLLEQLSRLLPSTHILTSPHSDLPEQIILANTLDRQGTHIATKLTNAGHKVIYTAGIADVKATLICLVGKIQRFCNTKTENPPLIKLALIGSDIFVNSLLRPYVEIFSSKPPDWQKYIKFFIIPIGLNNVSKYIGFQDSLYTSLFLHDSWKELLETAEPGPMEVEEIVSRISMYLNTPAELPSLNLPIAEAMVTYKEKSFDVESSCQVFLPFVCDVHVVSSHGCAGTPMDNSGLDNALLFVPGGTPPSSQLVNSTDQKSPRDKSSPPSSPCTFKESETTIDLQLDYWVHFLSTSQATNVCSSNTLAGSCAAQSSQTSDGATSFTSRRGITSSGIGDAFGSNRIRSDSAFAAVSGSVNANQTMKYSTKASIGYMHIGHSTGSCVTAPLSMRYLTKERKTKGVIRLGKKRERDGGDFRQYYVDGITRLICLSKSHLPLKVFVDGTEWNGVKFFQLSSQWQTHIKHLPIATFSSKQQTQSTSIVDNA